MAHRWQISYYMLLDNAPPTHLYDLSTYAPERDACDAAIYSSREVADERCRHYAESCSQHRFAVVPVGEHIALSWQDREARRFAGGTYRETPWHNESWYQAKHNEHYCHVSTEQPGKIAFTENAKKGEADRQLVMSPGRYLNRYFSDTLDNCAIEQWCAKLSVQLQEDALKFTQDADEIERVYVGGPSSCMSYEAKSYSGHCHPVRVYAGPDTALAYIGPIDDASARCVVWPEKLIYTRVYGDVSRMTLLLEQAGYTSGSLNGARIQRIIDERSGGYIMPYIDRGGGPEDEGDFLRIGMGDIESGSTSGVADMDDRPTCERCEDQYDADEGCSVYVTGLGGRHVEQTWCEHCADHRSTMCEHDDNRYSDDDFNFTEVHYGAHGCTITVMDDNLDAFGAVYVESRDEYWESDQTFYCEHTCRTCHVDDGMVERDGMTVCQEAADELDAAAAELEAEDEPVVLAA